MTGFDKSFEKNVLKYHHRGRSMMMNSLIIITNRFILEHMIKHDADYDKIVEQSQKLDKYINIAMWKKIKRQEKSIKY